MTPPSPPRPPEGPTATTGASTGKQVVRRTDPSAKNPKAAGRVDFSKYPPLEPPAERNGGGSR